MERNKILTEILDSQRTTSTSSSKMKIPFAFTYIALASKLTLTINLRHHSLHQLSTDYCYMVREDLKIGAHIKYFITTKTQNKGSCVRVLTGDQCINCCTLRYLLKYLITAEVFPFMLWQLVMSSEYHIYLPGHKT